MLQEKTKTQQKLGEPISEWVDTCWWYKQLIDGDIKERELYKEEVGNLKYCPECEIVWEVWKSNTASKYRRTIYEKYADFPNLGIKRKKCNGCK